MFEPAVFAARRDAVMRAIGNDAVLIVHSLPERLRNGSSYHLFRQHSDVLYLAGFLEPEATIVLRPGAERERFVMFVRPRDPEHEQWEGRRAGVEGARERYGADAAYPAAELATRLGDLIASVDQLYFALGVDPAMDALVASTIAHLRRMEKRGTRPPRAVVDPRLTLHELRLHKRPEEIEALRRAAALTSEAHVLAMAAGHPGMYEYELAALLDFTFRRLGGTGPGYASIVGAGDNATVLHYVDNRAALADGDLVLIDAGGEFEHYTADITRTWPASGRFSPAQRRVYETVLDAQTSAIELIRPGVTIDDLHHHCVRRLTEGMIELGLLSGTADQRIEDRAFRRFYMHGSSHWLGLDVHDVGAYLIDGKPRPLAPGMVITIEPGLYIPLDAPDVPAELRGIGVRIEDNVLLTEAGHEVLTAACPKSVAAVEAACAGG